jgi:hypothetical protein
MSVCKTQNRVLSRSEYIRYLSQKWVLSAVGRLLFLLGSLGTLLAILSVDALLLLQLFCWFVVPTTEGSLTGFEVMWCYLAVMLSLLLAFLGKKTMRSANQMEPVMLLTPRLADQLPAEESLVRACAEPELRLSILLVRAARFQETSWEELLRPRE